VAAILRYTQNVAEVDRMKLAPVLCVWANLVADWSAWSERDDQSVFDCIDELVALQVFAIILVLFPLHVLQLNFSTEILKVPWNSQNFESQK